MGKKKRFFNNKTKVKKISPNKILNITSNLSDYDISYANRCPLLKTYSDRVAYGNITEILRKASDAELETIVEEYFEYHDKTYGIDYKRDSEIYTENSKAHHIMVSAISHNIYKLVDKLAQKGVSIDACQISLSYYGAMCWTGTGIRTGTGTGTVTAVDHALFTKDEKLLEVIINNGGFITSLDLAKAFHMNNKMFEYLIDFCNRTNVNDNYSFEYIFHHIFWSSPGFEMDVHDIWSPISLEIDDNILHSRLRILLDKGANPNEIIFDRFTNIFDLAADPYMGDIRVDKSSLTRAYIKNGIGIPFINKICFEYDKNIVILHISWYDNNILKVGKYSYKSGYYSIIKCIENKHNVALEIINIINNILPLPIAEEITPNMPLL